MNKQPLTEEELRDIFTEYCSITDRYVQALIRKDTLILQQNETIEKLQGEIERYHGMIFGEPEKPEGSN
jgi:hypothetical protein